MKREKISKVLGIAFSVTLALGGLTYSTWRYARFETMYKTVQELAGSDKIVVTEVVTEPEPVVYPLENLSAKMYFKDTDGHLISSIEPDQTCVVRVRLTNQGKKKLKNLKVAAIDLAEPRLIAAGEQETDLELIVFDSNYQSHGGGGDYSS